MVLLACCACTGNAQQSDAKADLYDRVRNYWDGIDAGSLPDDSLEQHIVDYLYLAGHLEQSQRDSVWPDFYEHVKEQPNKIVVDYLGEADSPLYSPELLEEYLLNLMRHTDDETCAIRSEYLLDNIMKNPVGSIISDLKVSLNNKPTTLRQLIRDAGQDCLIIFYDPDCSSCDAAFRRLDAQPPAGLKIIAISVTSSTKAINESWVSAYVVDEAEMDSKFYYTTLPSTYVVNKDGVIQK